MHTGHPTILLITPFFFFFFFFAILNKFNAKIGSYLLRWHTTDVNHRRSPPAMLLITMLRLTAQSRDRTVSPYTVPSTRTTLYPGRSNMVVVMTPSVSV